jgi:hypothetical protein
LLVQVGVLGQKKKSVPPPIIRAPLEASKINQPRAKRIYEKPFFKLMPPPFLLFSFGVFGL